MKKTQKRVLGLCGLVLVAATTVFAAALPGPDVSAVEAQVKDTITVTVIGNKPDINITEPESGETTTSPVQDLRFTYEDVDHITITIIYTNPDGETTEYLYDEFNAGFNPGEYSNVLNLSGENYGYGRYTIKVEGDGPEGFPGTDEISFSYYPVTADMEQTPGTGGTDTGGGDGTGPGSSEGGGSSDGSGNDGTGGGSTGGDYTIKFDYDDESGLWNAIGATIMINDTDSGKLLKEIGVEPFPTDSYRLILSNYGLPSGNYTITIKIAYEYKGKIYYIYYTYYITYKAPSMKVPDTGGLFGNLNISKTDYLMTGLIVFGVIGLGGFVFIARRGKRTTRRR